MLAALFVGCLALQAVEVPFRVGAEAIVLDIEVNGRKVSTMFDTGFSGTLAIQEGVNIGPASGTQRLRDFVGSFEAKTVPIKSLRLGGKDLAAPEMSAVQKPMGHMTASYNTHTDGILGFEPFRDHVLEINFARKVLVIHPSSHDVSARTPDGDRTFLTRLLPIGHDSLEMSAVTPSGKRMTLALDTGNAFFAVTHRDVLERTELWDPKAEPRFLKQAYVASGLVDNFLKRMPPMTVFGVPIGSSVWSIIALPSSTAESDGTVGFGFLKHFNTTIDFGRRRVWFERVSDKVENDAPAEVGLIARRAPRETRFTVVRIVKGGPAEQVGVREGDQLLGVDGQDLVNLADKDVEQLLEGAAGTEVRLALSRHGAPIRVAAVRQSLVNP